MKEQALNFLENKGNEHTFCVFCTPILLPIVLLITLNLDSCI